MIPVRGRVVSCAFAVALCGNEQCVSYKRDIYVPLNYDILHVHTRTRTHAQTAQQYDANLSEHNV